MFKLAAQLVHDVGRPGLSSKYEARSDRGMTAVQTYCYDVQYFTSFTADVADDSVYSQHCQVFAVIQVVAALTVRSRTQEASRHEARFLKCL